MQKLKKLLAKSQLQQFVIVIGESVLVYRIRVKVTLNKPIYVGFTILDVSKLLMFDLYYSVVVKRYCEDVRYAAAYAGWFDGTNKINSDEGNNIDRSDHAGGYALYAYDLTPDLAENDQVNLSQQGTVRLNLKFGAAHTITVVAYAEFENMIEIDRNRNILFDFSVFGRQFGAIISN
jgi:hypothetical protein